MSNVLIPASTQVPFDNGTTWGSLQGSSDPYGSFEGWTTGAQNGGVMTAIADNELKGTWPADAGGTYLWATKNISQFSSSDVYVQFQAKMPNLKHGFKFLKIFGQDTGNSYVANCTLQCNYNGGDLGSIYQISFGDGTANQNDTQNVINLDGSNPEAIGRSFGTAVVATPQNAPFSASDWGTDYHNFKFHVKFNSGTSAETEVADGEFYLEIDGLVYVSATGLLNRNWINPPINKVELFGHTQGASPASPWDVYYKNPIVSTVGFS